MNAITFDTLKFARKLEAGGFTREQADTVSEAILEASQDMHSETAKQSDLKDIRTEMKDIRNEIVVLRAEFKADLKSGLMEQTIKLGAMLFALGGILIAVKFFV